MTFKEFTGKNVEEAIRTAMAEFSADLGELDIEILSQGKRGMLGVGGEEARILAAPKSAVDAAETVRAEPIPDEPIRDEPIRDEPIRDEPIRDEPIEPAAAAEAPQDAPEPEPIGIEPSDADDQAAELAAAGRTDAGRRSRGGRGRGGRGRDGRDRDHGIREPRTDRPPREPRTDRPSREPAPFVSGKPLDELSDEERATLETARTVLEEMLSLMGVSGTVEIASGGETARLNVRGDDLGSLIGRRGEKLASL